MFAYELWVNMNIWGQTDRHTQTDRQTHRHIITMTRPGLGAGPSENVYLPGGKIYLTCDNL